MQNAASPDISPDYDFLPLQVGTVVIPPLEAEYLARNGIEVEGFLARHKSGDWGDITIDSLQFNLYGAKYEDVVVSSYRLQDGNWLCIDTAGDRSQTYVSVPTLTAVTSPKPRFGLKLFGGFFRACRNLTGHVLARKEQA